MVEAPLSWYLLHPLQIVLGVVFLLAAVSKLRRPAAFTGTLAGYGLFPAATRPAVAAGVIGVEGFLAVTLLTGWLATTAIPLALTTFGLFLAVMLVTLRRGRRVRCGCFGDLEETLSARTVLRLLVLIAATAVLLLFTRGFGTETFVVTARFGAYTLEVTTVALFVLVSGNWLLRLPELIAVLRTLFRPTSDIARGA